MTVNNNFKPIITYLLLVDNPLVNNKIVTKEAKHMQKIISWYMEHKTYGNILIIGIIGLMLYNIGYGVGTAIYRIFG